jgi:hypothetical protein
MDSQEFGPELTGLRPAKSNKKNNMLKIKWLALFTALNLVLGLNVRADDATTGTGDETTVEDGTVKGEKPETPENPEAPDEDVSGEKPEHPEHPEKPEKPQRPEKPESPGKSVEMKELVGDFRAKLTELNTQRKDLAKQIKDATEEERAKLREELAANREAIGKLKEQFRDDVKELHANLKNHTDKVDAETKAEAKAAAKSGRSRE